MANFESWKSNVEFWLQNPCGLFLKLFIKASSLYLDTYVKSAWDNCVGPSSVPKVQVLCVTQ